MLEWGPLQHPSKENNTKLEWFDSMFFKQNLLTLLVHSLINCHPLSLKKQLKLLYKNSFFSQLNHTPKLVLHLIWFTTEQFYKCWKLDNCTANNTTNFKIEILQGATKILSFFTELVTKEICAYLIWLTLVNICKTLPGFCKGKVNEHLKSAWSMCFVQGPRNDADLPQFSTSSQGPAHVLPSL